MAYNFKGKLVLVVEDNFMSYKLIEAHLKRNNVDILHASDGNTALKLFNENPDIELILMDIQLPGMNGLQVTATMREQPTDVPIIATTANAFPDDRIACMEAGCTDYVTKPIDFDILLKKLSNYLL